MQKRQLKRRLKEEFENAAMYVATFFHFLAIFLAFSIIIFGYFAFFTVIFGAILGPPSPKCLCWPIFAYFYLLLPILPILPTLHVLPVFAIS